MKNLIKLSILSIFFVPINMDFFRDDENVSIRFYADYASVRYEDKDWSDWITSNVYIVYNSDSFNSRLTIYASEVSRYIIYREESYTDHDNDQVFKWYSLCRETNEEVNFRLVIFYEKDHVHIYMDREDFGIVYNINRLE